MRVCAQNTNPKESIEVYVEPSDGAVLLYDAPKGKTVCTLEEKGEYMFSVCSPKNGWWRICSKINTGEASEIEVTYLDLLFGISRTHAELRRTNLVAICRSFYNEQSALHL